MEEVESEEEKEASFTIEFDQETLARLQKASNQLQCSPSDLVRHSLHQGLTEIEAGNIDATDDL